MSFHVLSWVADHSPTKGAARLLLVMMADMANDEGWMEAKTATLAARCNVDSERAIQKQINALEKSGAIQVIPQAADSGRSLNNAFVIITPGRTPRVSKRSPSPNTQAPQGRAKESSPYRRDEVLAGDSAAATEPESPSIDEKGGFRPHFQTPPRVSKRSPSPECEPAAHRAKESSPSHPVQTFTLTPSESSPSPRPNVHPHKGTVLQESTDRNLTEQQQQPRARAGGEVRPAEEVEALRRNIEQLAERDGLGFDRVALWVTSGKASGRQQCRGTLSFETMSEKHMRRSLVDSNTLLNPPPSRRVPL